MITAKLLIEADDQQEYRIFHFDENSVNGIYVIDSDTMGVIINGSDFIIEYNGKIFERIKKVLEQGKIFFN